MKKITCILAAALVMGFTACTSDPDDREDTVEITIGVTFPNEYDGVSLADIALDGVTVLVGGKTVYTNEEGKANVQIPAGNYQVIASVRRLVEGMGSAMIRGMYAFNLQGVKNASFSASNHSTTVDLEISGTPEFASYGSILAVVDTVRMEYKGDTLDLAPLFTAVLEPGSTGTFSFEMAAKPQKKETGFGTNGNWVDLADTYVIDTDGHSIIAIDSLPACWNLPQITDKMRELKPAMVRAILSSGGKVIAIKEIPVVQEIIIPELIKFTPVEDITGRIKDNVLYAGYYDRRLYGAPGSASGFSMINSNIMSWYSDGSTYTGNSSLKWNEDHTSLTTIYNFKVKVENTDGIAITTTSSTEINYYVGMPAGCTNIYPKADSSALFAQMKLNATGKLTYYPYYSTPDDWRSYTLGVKVVNVTGVKPAPESVIAAGAGALRFKTGGTATVQVRMQTYTMLEGGLEGLYDLNEHGNNQMLCIPGTLTDDWAGGTAVEFSTANSGTLVAVISPGYNHLKLTSTSVPAGVNISYKACPKHHWTTTDGGLTYQPDPNWTITINTKVYPN